MSVVPTIRVAVYKIRNELAHCSIEQGTGGVPDDGYFYVLQNSLTAGRFRKLPDARKLYDSLTQGAPRNPAVPLSVDELIQIDMHRMSNKELIWQPEDFRRVERKTRGRAKHGGGRP